MRAAQAPHGRFWRPVTMYHDVVNFIVHWRNLCPSSITMLPFLSVINHDVTIFVCHQSRTWLSRTWLCWQNWTKLFFLPLLTHLCTWNTHTRVCDLIKIRAFMPKEQWSPTDFTISRSAWQVRTWFVDRHFRCTQRIVFIWKYMKMTI